MFKKTKQKQFDQQVLMIVADVESLRSYFTLVSAKFQCG